MLVPRYNYKPLDKVTIGGKRHYDLPNGSKVPSVTTVLEKTKSQESRDALAAWKQKVGIEKAQQITTEAANRGTRMHSYLEHWVINGTQKDRGTNPFSWPSHAMAEVVIREGLSRVSEFWGTEVPLYFPAIYAGTTDCVGLHEGAEAIMDFKQTNRPKRTEWIEEYFLQLAAYAEAHDELYGTKINRGVILMCVKPDTDDQGNIITLPQYQEWITEGAEFDQWKNRWWARVEQYYQSYA